MNTRRIFRTAGVLCVLLVPLLLYRAVDHWPAIRYPTMTLSGPVSQPMDTILIVSWTTKMRTQENIPWFQEGFEDFTKCDLPEGATCEYYHNRSLADTSDVILFKGTALSTRQMPKKRVNQTWVFWERETPQTRTGGNWHSVGHLFDIAMTYSTSTDLTEPYGYCVERQTSSEGPERNYAAGKTGQVAWIVSSCRPPTKRQLYVNELKKHISIDIYGKCGTKSCLPWQSADCLESLLRKKYKFYLAFENSFCKDYITEKFFNSLDYDCLPIVLGIGNYTEHAPAHSYLDIRDFKSPKHLADYLTILDKNDTLYNEYFSWKRTHECRTTDFSKVACKLCSFLHERKRGHHQELNLKKVWINAAECQSGDTFRKNCNCWP